jgi:chorismate mutase/prephenate dehydratase
MKLKSLRKTVDSIDSKIVGLINKRAGVILDIAKIKGRTKGSIYVPDRERSVYSNIVSGNKGPMSNDSLKAIFREVMSGSLQLERPLSIAYLGPECTFTHLAAMKKFGSSVGYASCDTITDVFSEVDKRHADYGVVPIENSIEGAVNHTLDMFVDSSLKVCSEIFLEISHNLLSNETDKTKIRKLYSKREVFGQCRVWIESNLPKAELVEVSSTARAAEIASKEKGAGCIAGEFASEKYALNAIYRSIEDNAHNMTRFLVIGRTDALPTGKDKTSVMVSVKDRAGALHDMLVPFKRHNVSLTKIESRPSKVRAWEYYFFMDMVGHAQDAGVRKALSELSKAASYLKVLGSYPVVDRDA